MSTRLKVATRFWYVRRHVPTGKETTDSIVCDTPSELLHLLDQWNRSCPDTWSYRSAQVSAEMLNKDERNKYERTEGGTWTQLVRKI